MPAHLTADLLFHIVGNIGFQLKPDHPAAPPPFDGATEIANQILCFFLDFDIAVADDPKSTLPNHAIAREEDIGMAPYDRFHRDILSLFAWRTDKSRQGRRHHH